MTKPPNQNIHVITGKVKGGKTAFLSTLVEGLKNQDLKITGFLSMESMEGKLGAGFILRDLERGRQVHLASIEKRKGWFGFRRFHFNPVAFIQGEKWIRNGLLRHPDLVVIDEVGPMEMEGFGWWKILIHLEQLDDVRQLWIVREQILPQIMLKWSVADENIYRIDEVDQSTIIARLSAIIKASRKT